MNSTRLKELLKNKSKERNIDFNTLLRTYMYERFIERLSVSEHKDNFILKGGFYLSNFLGLDKRTTMDIDTAFKNSNFTEENITEMIKDILSIDLDDNMVFTLESIDPIRDEDDYGGYRLIINVKMDNIRDRFHLDIATGDPITPKEIKYNYNAILENKNFKVWAYNIETVLAEKVETVLARGELNGRMKDFYDVYLIYTIKWDEINVSDLKNAMQRTFEKRGYTDNPSESIKIIEDSDILKVRWNAYVRKNKTISDLSFDDMIKCVINVLKEVGLY